MVDARLVVVEIFFEHLLLLLVVLAFLGHVLHVVVHTHVLLVLSLLVTGSHLGIPDVSVMLDHFLFFVHNLVSGLNLALLLGILCNVQVVVLVAYLLNIALC